MLNRSNRQWHLSILGNAAHLRCRYHYDSTYHILRQDHLALDIPCLMLALLAFGYFRGVLVYEVFVDGAKDGFVAIRIILICSNSRCSRYVPR